MPRKSLDGDLLASEPGDVVLGMDPSLTGFGLTALSKQTSRFETWLYRSDQRGVERLLDIRSWLESTISLLQGSGFVIHDAAVEDTVVASHSATSMGELSGLVRIYCREAFDTAARYPLRVPPTSVKKYATDRGNAKKSEVMLGVYKKWGVEFRDDNMADSYVLAQIAAGNSNAQYESTVIEKLSDPKFRDSQKV